MQIIPETDKLRRCTRLGLFNCFLVRAGSEFTLVDTNLPGSTKGTQDRAASPVLPPLKSPWRMFTSILRDQGMRSPKPCPMRK
jgi:hypothetical protein